MNKNEFEVLRNLKDKFIEDDIEFQNVRGMGQNLTFEKIPVENSMGYKILLNGEYSPRLKKIKYNFVLSGIGPICRIEVNGQCHKDKCRNHKHELIKESDPERNLPNAYPRPDLENKTPSELWEIVCKEAKIQHRGRLKVPL
jgi:hypothetical protein